MKKEYEVLFTPWHIGKVKIKNRIVLCPMGGTSLFGWMEPNHFDKVAAQFFLERAQNNVGLIIPGIAPLKDTFGGRWLYENKKMFQELKPYMGQIHQTGAKLFVQLTAGFGRSFAITEDLKILLKNKGLATLAKPIIDAQYICASPSELPSRWAEDITCRAITKREIQELVTAFAKTAKLCKEAGVDGVEVHAVHEGYLMDQFTLPYTNFRKDEYGGSFENRYRFAVEVVKAIKEACGQDYPVSLRYSAISKTKGFNEGAIYGEEDYVEVGRDLIESEKAVKYLEAAGYDMLNTDNGTYDAWYWSHPPQYMPQNCNLNDAAHIRKFVDIPVVCAGRMTLDAAAKAITENRIDAMGVARQFLADGQWVTKVLEDREDDILPCICCHNACFPLAHYKGVANDESFSDARGMSRCALNPQTMQGHKYDIKPAKKRKKIAIIGGGVAGMEFARIATLRQHQVTIYEKSNDLGGVFVAAAAPFFKEKDKELLKWYKKQIKDLNIEVKYQHEIKDISTLDADEIVIATGSIPKNLNVKGCEKAIDAIDYLNGHKTGENVVIIGGGLSGCEIAFDLYHQGKKPIIVESKNDLMATRGLCLANSSYLRDFFKVKKVEVYLESKVLALEDDKVIIIDQHGQTISLKTDTIIKAIGYDSNPLHKRAPRIHVIGDANKVGNLRTVVWQAWKKAITI
ncbi:MAG: FAD-dependent oxidoreductase [Erysipelotrichaceae bacterium]|nr:FAD-dependent oxidoreductase [Erysipelotrichaceae bacterium]MDY5252164.1 FAD-dependent oxidoreductase [Erysipelotrichaceae bacterium]